MANIKLESAVVKRLSTSPSEEATNDSPRKETTATGIIT